MTRENEVAAKGTESAQGLKKSTDAEERKIEQQTGSDLAKGADRFEERSKSSDGKSSGEKQI